VEDLRATRAKGRLVVVALAAATMLAAPLALLHGGAATTAATGTPAHGGRTATTSPATSIGPTQLVSSDAPTTRHTHAQAIRHRSAVRHNDQLVHAAWRRAARQHASAVQAAAVRSAADHAGAAGRSARRWLLERHVSAVRHNELLDAAQHRLALAAAAAARHERGHSATGIATWYAWYPGQCASPFLPHGTLLTVTDLATHKTIQCLVTDTEAHNPGRVVDLSNYCFEELGALSKGVILVRITW
jgi:hypothetical protein